MKNELSVQPEREETTAPSAQSSALMTRAQAEVQSAMIIAKRFPRDESAAIARILRACTRVGLAEASVYEYERGGQKITGPSIRLAEALAQNWGNLDFGIVELEQKAGESQVMAFAHDLETNTRQVKIFTVPHIRYTRAGSYAVTDPRDVYEMVANNGARRMRACVLGVIPGDVTNAALEACDRTLEAAANASKDPRDVQIAKLVSAFESVGAPVARLEEKLGHKIAALTNTEIAKLKKTFAAIRDGFTTAAEQFPVAGAPAEVAKSVATAGAKPTPSAETPKEMDEELFASAVEKLVKLASTAGISMDRVEEYAKGFKLSVGKESDAAAIVADWSNVASRIGGAK